MYDFHLHSHFSSDSVSTMKKMALAGKNLGLKGVCFTDHIDLDYSSSEISFEFSYKEYIEELSNIKALILEDFEIYTGVEIGIQPHTCTANEVFLKDKNFDFIISSVHCVGKKDMYYGSFLEGITPHEGTINYFQDMLHCLENFNDFDVLGHLDVIRRYLPEGEKNFSYNIYKEFIDNILSRLIISNKGIELNTSGMRYGLSSFHPLPEILKLYRLLGGEIITIGSDSHTPDIVGYQLKNALAQLSEIGFKYYTIFKDRKPVFIKI